jgi:hypothetical protein
MAHGKPLYQIFFNHLEGTLKPLFLTSVDSGGMHWNMWKQLLEVYPEPAEVTPVFFSRYGPDEIDTECFLYFEQKGPRKIYYIRPGLPNDVLVTLFPNSIAVLDDSQKLIRYWREQGIKELTPHSRGITGGR